MESMNEAHERRRVDFDLQAGEAFLCDGAFCLRGVFRDWVEPLRHGVETNLADPGPHGQKSIGDAEQGRFFNDYCNWQRIPEFSAFLHGSSVATVAGLAMGANRAQFFHEHVLVKEAGPARATPWHHDMPYYCVEGTQTVTVWVALDDVPLETTLRFVAGSHRWGRLFYPRWFKDGANYDYRGPGYEPVPDIDAEPERHRILAWPLLAGDALLFDFRTLHGTLGTPLKQRRRAFAARWLGDDVRYCERPGRTSPPFPGLQQNPGEAMREDWFPVLWRAGVSETQP